MCGGFPVGSVVKNHPLANAGDPGSIPGTGRSLGEGNGNPLQYSCLGNPTDRGAWWTTVLGVTKELDTTECLTLSLLILEVLSVNIMSEREESLCY